MSNIIKVPKPSRDAYNPDRPLHKNLLIASQIRHFAEADKNLAPEYRTGVDVESIKTEGQASEYIRKVTQAIHTAGGRAPLKVARSR